MSEYGDFDISFTPGGTGYPDLIRSGTCPASRSAVSRPESR